MRPLLLISFFFLGFIILVGSDQTMVPLPPDNNYRAAKYSVEIDFTYVQDLTSGLPNSAISYRYYVQYGEDLLIQLTDPGNELKHMPYFVSKWDYTTGEFTREYIFHDGKKYYKDIDSIRLSIHENRGTIKDLCDSATMNLKCDSVTITLNSTNSEYLLYLSDSIANIKASDLFYPDIKFLPYKIINKSQRNSPKILEEVIYGKESIDSLLSLYNHRGYERITDHEWRSAIHKLPPENLEIIEIMQKRMQERKNRD